MKVGEILNYYELTITIYLLQDLYFTKSNEKIGQIINKAMYLDNYLSEKHEKNEYKFYVYNNLYPLETDKTYKEGRIYIFKIRTLDSIFADKIKILLLKVEDECLKIVSTDIKIVRKNQITELYTVTPVLITIDNKYWLPQDDFILLQHRLHANLEKKYKAFYKKEFHTDYSFMQYIELLNKIPLSLYYKNTKLLANKFKIIPNEDEESQILAFMAEATGIGEKNSSVGLGFCNAQYLK